MSLTSKLKADYIELINAQLDHIPIECVEEFDLIKEALSNICSPTAGYSVPEALRERIFNISDILNSPKDYVEFEENYAEYQKIIRGRIEKKVVELQSWSEEQKLAYIKTHQERRTAAAQYQEKIAGHQAPKPGSEAHTISEREMLLQSQRQFEEEARQRRTSDATRLPGEQFFRQGSEAIQPNPLIQALQTHSNVLSQFVDMLTPDQLRMLFSALPSSVQSLQLFTQGAPLVSVQEAVNASDGLLTAGNLAGMDSPAIRAAIQPECLQALREGLFTESDLVNMRSAGVIRAITQPECLQALREGRTTIDLLVQMDEGELRVANITGRYPTPPLFRLQPW